MMDSSSPVHHYGQPLHAQHMCTCTPIHRYAAYRAKLGVVSLAKPALGPPTLRDDPTDSRHAYFLLCDA